MSGRRGEFKAVFFIKNISGDLKIFKARVLKLLS